MDIRQLIDTTRMGGYQWLIIGLAAFLNALDGYDLVAMAFTSQSVSADFGLSGAQLGWLLSAALIGIGVGSIILAPLADRFGRRRLIITALLIDLVGLTCSSFATNFETLLAFRALTGIGVGGILACVTVVVSEYSNLRFRGLAMSIYSAGYGLGASLCGVLAAQAIPAYGWQSVFITGAGLTLLALALTLFFLPESVDHLAARGRTEQVEAVARRLGKSGPVTASAKQAGEQPRTRTREILSSGYLGTTLKLWVAFSLITFGFNFANQWTPQLLTESGLSAQQGIIGGIMLSFGGTIGSLIYGALTTRLHARRLLIAFSLLSAVALVAFISATDLPTLMFAAGVAVGMLLNGCVTGMYTITPQAYPAALRTTGVGTAIGVSRAGAVIAPIAVGYLFDAGWSPVALYLSAAVIVALAAVALIGVRAHSGSHDRAGSADALQERETVAAQ
ncbi:MFS transporter [Corynebacterium halotolerans]|uniref:Permease of the major facilitator superfamily protein n=1 Tax=Corynebacterium halotolerans YIM 70093 = DSM 44683 TaxID=1121362 RepID=M1P960_9CORY|nr:MFS transporter [Corynebacterium halotolerans]AGF73221.1 permease of the major facilitator superfamily protein [Corynebacterium halotolerans YIM 70093 = DSM 44683]